MGYIYSARKLARTRLLIACVGYTWSLIDTVLDLVLRKATRGNNLEEYF